jgi:hypothetical protein
MNTDQAQANTASTQPERWAKLFGIPSPQQAAPEQAAPAREDRRPRRMTVEAMRTDTVLAHAIEYLTDDRQIPSGKVTELWPGEPDVQAILLMMEARHRLYLECPVIERRSLLGLMGTFKGPERRRR